MSAPDWDHAALPILRFIARREGQLLVTAAIADALDLSVTTVNCEVRRLDHDGWLLIEGNIGEMMTGSLVLSNAILSPKACRTLRMWPEETQ